MKLQEYVEALAGAVASRPASGYYDACTTVVLGTAARIAEEHLPEITAILTSAGYGDALNRDAMERTVQEMTQLLHNRK